MYLTADWLHKHCWSAILIKVLDSMIKLLDSSNEISSFESYTPKMFDVYRIFWKSVLKTGHSCHGSSADFKRRSLLRIHFLLLNLLFSSNLWHWTLLHPVYSFTHWPCRKFSLHFLWSYVYTNQGGLWHAFLNPSLMDFLSKEYVRW